MTYANEFMNSVSRGTIFKKIIYLLLTGFLSTKLLQRRPQLSLLFMYRKVLNILTRYPRLVGFRRFKRFSSD